MVARSQERKVQNAQERLLVVITLTSTSIFTHACSPVQSLIIVAMHTYIHESNSELYRLEDLKEI